MRLKQQVQSVVPPCSLNELSFGLGAHELRPWLVANEFIRSGKKQVFAKGIMQSCDASDFQTISNLDFIAMSGIFCHGAGKARGGCGCEQALVGSLELQVSGILARLFNEGPTNGQFSHAVLP